MAKGKPSIGPELKRLRRLAGLSARSTAEILEVPTSSYEKYEDRSQKPFLPLAIVARLVTCFSVYGVKVDEIWELADPEDIKSFMQAWRMTNEDTSQVKKIVRDVKALEKKINALTIHIRERDSLIEFLVSRYRPSEEIKIIKASFDLKTRRRFANNILRLRKNKRLTQKQLGFYVGVRGGTVSRWESGGSVPSDKIIAKLAEVLDCCREDIFSSHIVNGKNETREKGETSE